MELKKQAVDLTELAIGILILGIVVSIGATILIQFRDTKVGDLSTYTTTNESLSFSNSQATLSKFGTGSVTVTNQSSGATIGTGNYTVSTATDGRVTITNLTRTWQDWYATYTALNTSRADYSLTDDAATGLAEYGNWFKIIVIVGVAALVLGIIFLTFGRSKGAEVGQSY